MSNTDFRVAIRVAATPAAAFAAINNVPAWWTGEVEGRSHALGDEFTYRYKDLHYSKQRLTEFVPDRRVAWKVVEGMLGFVDDKTEWEGTAITFDIAPKGDETEVVMTHVGLTPQVECYDACSTSWALLVSSSLKSLIETGKASPVDLERAADVA